MNNDLKIINQNGVLVADSRDVAKMIGKEHDKLLRDIRNYISQIKQVNEESPKLESPIKPSDYFIESDYNNSQNKKQPCYLITKIGCDFVANKLIGVKGTAFTAIYTKRFDEMEKELKNLSLNQYLNMSEEDRAILYFQNLKEKKRIAKENEKNIALIGTLKPKADYTDIILKTKDLVTITQIAKDYGMSAIEMNKVLHDLKVQYKQSEQWLLYSEYQAKGYTKSETIKYTHKDGTDGSKLHTKWTQKGRLFLYELLKKNGILPMIEKESAA